MIIDMNALESLHPEMLELAEMQVNPLAQRALSERKVSKLVANFNPQAVGTLLVSSRVGVYWVVDGQTRREAMLRLGITAWPCEVRRGLTLAEEARLFLVRNDSLVVEALDKFYPAITAGEPRETEVQRVLAGLGLCIGRKGSEGAGAIHAVNAVLDVYDTHGSDVLATTMMTLRDAWGATGKAYRKDYILGLTHILTTYPKADLGRVSRRLANISPQRLYSEIKFYADVKADESAAVGIAKWLRGDRSLRRTIGPMFGMR